MWRGWNFFQSRALLGRSSCLLFEEVVNEYPLHPCFSSFSSPWSLCPCSLNDTACYSNGITISKAFIPSVAPPSSFVQCFNHFSFRYESHSILEIVPPIGTCESMETSNSSLKSWQGVRFCPGTSGWPRGSCFTAQGCSAMGGNVLAGQLVYARYSTSAVAEKEELDMPHSITGGTFIQPSVAALDVVDVTEPNLVPLEDELLEEPGALSHVTDLEEKLRCLRDWGLTDKNLAKLRLHLPSSVRSALLKNSAKKLVEVALFLVEECGINKMKVAHALLGNVFLASSSIEECLRPKVQYLLSLGITKDQVARIIERCPQVLTYSMEQRVLPMERKLIEIGLKVEDIGKAVLRYPGLLGTGITKFDRTVKFLNAAGVVEMAKCISRHPQILSLSLDGKVHVMTAFLKSDLQLPTDQINKTISMQPSIFTYSVDFNLRPKVTYLQNLGLEKQEIGRMVALHPAIMGHSLESAIKPKIDYLVNVMNREVNEIVSFPQYLSYSLCTRIQPRYEYLAERGILISLSSMLSCRSEVFERRYGNGYEPPMWRIGGYKHKPRSY